MDFKSMALAAFFALGGMALLWGYAKKFIPIGFDKLGDLLLKYPKLRKWVGANAKDLKEVMQASEKELEKDIDKAAEEPEQK